MSKSIKVVFDFFTPALSVYEILTIVMFDFETVCQGHGFYTVTFTIAAEQFREKCENVYKSYLIFLI